MTHLLTVLLVTINAHATDISIYDSVSDKDSAVVEVCDNQVCDRLLVKNKDLESGTVVEWAQMVHNLHIVNKLGGVK